MDVSFYFEDRGNYRNYYKPVDKKDKRLYCTQPSIEGQEEWFVCSKDGEPCHQPSYLVEIKD